MKIVILSGGSGKRLWPLYGDTRSKQFLKVLVDDEGKKESMIMRVTRQISRAFPEADVFIAASGAQLDPIRRQLDREDMVIIEPERKGTYPAVILSGAYIMDRCCPDPEEVMIVIPVDPYVEQDYFDAAAGLSAALSVSGAEIALMGIKPTYPSEKYGYISGNVTGKDSYGRVASYVEKPDLHHAIALKEAGARWNGGIFAFRMSFVEKEIESLIERLSSHGHTENPEGYDRGTYERICSLYHYMPSISFDRQILEKNSNMIYIPYDGEWKDLGTWNTLTEKMHDPDGGRVIRDDGCSDTHVINELEIPIVALGLKNTVVVASADGILVSDKKSSSYMMPYVEQIDDRPMYEKRQWGEYRVVDLCQCSDGGEKTLTKRLFVEKGRSLSYQVHKLRDEIWTITDGEGVFLLDGERKRVKRGDVLRIIRGQWHSLAAVKAVEIIEVQLGRELVEEDIERQPYDWSDIWDE